MKDVELNTLFYSTMTCTMSNDFSAAGDHFIGDPGWLTTCWPILGQKPHAEHLACPSQFLYDFPIKNKPGVGNNFGLLVLILVSGVATSQSR